MVIHKHTGGYGNLTRVKTYLIWYKAVIEVIVAIRRHKRGDSNRGEGSRSDKGQGISRKKEEKGEEEDII